MQRLDIALEAAVLVIRSGGSTVAAERSFRNILGGEPPPTVWRLDFVGADAEGITALRAVGPIGVNLVRAAEVAALGDRAAREEVNLSTLQAEIERIKHLPSPYSRWVSMAGAAAAGGCFSQISGGDWGSLFIAPVAAGLGQLLRSKLQAKKFAVASTNLICGMVSALVAAAGVRLGYSQVESATLIASVMYIVPGLPLINGFIDMTSHRHLLVGVERMINASFLFLVLAIAIAFAHAVAGL